MHGRKAFPLADQISIGGPPLAALRLLLSNLKELIGKRTSERKVDTHTAHTRVMPALEFRHAMKMVKFAVATRAEEHRPAPLAHAKDAMRPRCDGEPRPCQSHGVPLAWVPPAATSARGSPRERRNRPRAKCRGVRASTSGASRRSSGRCP